jgi:hypothetical protein
MSSLLYQLSYSLIIIILAKQASTLPWVVKPYLCSGRLAMLCQFHTHRHLLPSGYGLAEEHNCPSLATGAAT